MAPTPIFTGSIAVIERGSLGSRPITVDLRTYKTKMHSRVNLARKIFKRNALRNTSAEMLPDFFAHCNAFRYVALTVAASLPVSSCNLAIAEYVAHVYVKTKDSIVLEWNFHTNDTYGIHVNVH